MGGIFMTKRKSKLDEKPKACRTSTLLQTEEIDKDLKLSLNKVSNKTYIRSPLFDVIIG